MKHLIFHCLPPPLPSPAAFICCCSSAMRGIKDPGLLSHLIPQNIPYSFSPVPQGTNLHGHISQNALYTSIWHFLFLCFFPNDLKISQKEIRLPHELFHWRMMSLSSPLHRTLCSTRNGIATELQNGDLFLPSVYKCHLTFIELPLIT